MTNISIAAIGVDVVKDVSKYLDENKETYPKAMEGLEELSKITVSMFLHPRSMKKIQKLMEENQEFRDMVFTTYTRFHMRLKYDYERLGVTTDKLISSIVESVQYYGGSSYMGYVEKHEMPETSTSQILWERYNSSEANVWIKYNPYAIVLFLILVYYNDNS